MALQVSADLQHVLKEDAGLELNVSKTAFLPRTSPGRVRSTLRKVSSPPPPVSRPLPVTFPSPRSFLQVLLELGYIGTDAFVQKFVAKTCRTIIDVEKLDAIQDGLYNINYYGFCQATRLQYLNDHIFLGNTCTLQQQHVDCKIADVLLKRGINQHCRWLGHV